MNKNRQAVIDWIEESCTEFNYAITLTFPTKQAVTEAMAKSCCNRFRSFYNSGLGYKNFKRKEKVDKTKSAPIVSMLEGDGISQRFHYHLALHKPADMSPDKFAALIKYSWQRAVYGEFCKIDIQPITSAGWANYISKKVTSTNTDVLDVTNTNIH
ncbi:hypothetical protein [Nitrincola sp.]|uniref:hypothetical protein n=1 Tax=Nitrincola sp. TaxID=1926584 RepID=UPI003A9486C5